MIESLIDKKQQLSTLKLQDKVLALLEEVVADFDQKWGGGKMSAAVYDIAWVAMYEIRITPKS